MDGDGVISISIVQHRLDLAPRDGGGYGPWGLVGLSGAELVQLGVVNDPPGAAICFGADHHPGTPLEWLIDRKLLNDFQSLIPV